MIRRIVPAIVVNYARTVPNEQNISSCDICFGIVQFGLNIRLFSLARRLRKMEEIHVRNCTANSSFFVLSSKKIRRDEFSSHEIHFRGISKVLANYLLKLKSLKRI